MEHSCGCTSKKMGRLGTCIWDQEFDQSTRWPALGHQYKGLISVQGSRVHRAVQPRKAKLFEASTA